MAEIRGRRDLRILITDLHTMPTEIRREVRPRLREAVEPTLAKVRARASWSQRIPAATKAQTSLGLRRPGVRIFVDTQMAPHAPYYENNGVAGTFWHPVYGNRRVWVQQRARPFLFQTVADDEDRLAEEIADVVPDVARKHGFR